MKFESAIKGYLKERIIVTAWHDGQQGDESGDAVTNGCRKLKEGGTNMANKIEELCHGEDAETVTIKWRLWCIKEKKHGAQQF